MRRPPARPAHGRAARNRTATDRAAARRLFDEPHAGIEHEQRQIGRIHVGPRRARPAPRSRCVSAHSDEKQMPSRPRPSMRRNLSLAVIAAVATPACDISPRIVSLRISRVGHHHLGAGVAVEVILPAMPCTAGGAPVTIETLFGLVKVGITASAVPSRPRGKPRDRRQHAGLRCRARHKPDRTHRRKSPRSAAPASGTTVRSTRSYQPSSVPFSSAEGFPERPVFFSSGESSPGLVIIIWAPISISPY